MIAMCLEGRRSSDAHSGRKRNELRLHKELIAAIHNVVVDVFRPEISTRAVVRMSEIILAQTNEILAQVAVLDISLNTPDIVESWLAEEQVSSEVAIQEVAIQTE